MIGKLRLLPPPSTVDRRSLEAQARVAFRRWRCTAELSQEQAAAWLGVSSDSVSAWERGVKRLPAWVLVATSVERSEAA
jgi:DNA-binding transcriptional regulator YiaG